MGDTVNEYITNGLPVILDCDYNFGDEKYFLYNHRVHKGIIEGMKGEVTSNSKYIYLKMYVSYGEMAMTEWIDINDLYDTKEELIKNL